jgi:hypothetical protein
MVGTDVGKAGKYDSPQGGALCKKILAKYLQYDPHDYQLDGICPAMNGYDLLATTPTGSGNTGYFTMFMLVDYSLLQLDRALSLHQGISRQTLRVVVCDSLHCHIHHEDGKDNKETHRESTLRVQRWQQNQPPVSGQWFSERYMPASSGMVHTFSISTSCSCLNLARVSSKDVMRLSSS